MKSHMPNSCPKQMTLSSGEIPISSILLMAKRTVSSLCDATMIPMRLASSFASFRTCNMIDNEKPKLTHKLLNINHFVCVKTHLNSSQTFGQRLVVHFGGGLVVGIRWIGVAQRSCTGTLLFDVRSAHQFRSKVKVLTFRLLQIGAYLR